MLRCLKCRNCGEPRTRLAVLDLKWVLNCYGRLVPMLIDVTGRSPPASEAAAEPRVLLYDPVRQSFHRNALGQGMHTVPCGLCAEERVFRLAVVPALLRGVIVVTAIPYQRGGGAGESGNGDDGSPPLERNHAVQQPTCPGLLGATV